MIWQLARLYWMGKEPVMDTTGRPWAGQRWRVYLDGRAMRRAGGGDEQQVKHFLVQEPTLALVAVLPITDVASCCS